MVLVRGFPVAPRRDDTGRRALPGADRFGLAAYAAAIVLYVLIGVLAVRGGLEALRTEAVLQTLLVFLGFNVAWLLLLDDPGPLVRGRKPGRNNRAMQIFAEAGAYQPPSGEPNDWIVHLNTSDLSLGTYSIPAGGVDDQTPHTEDEIYVVKTGRATLVTTSGTAPVGPGSVIYVPAGEEHRFTDVTEDLALIVVFAPPYGSGPYRDPALPGLGHARRLFDAPARQRVGALVTGITRVPLHPHPGHVVRPHRLDKPAPQVVVLDRLLGRGLPAVALPALDPLGDPVEQVSYQVCRLTLVGRCSPSSAWMAAISSIQLIMVSGSLPYIPFSLPCHWSTTPHPPAPGSRCTRRLCRSRPRSCRKVTPCRSPVPPPGPCRRDDLRWTPGVRTGGTRRGVEQFGSSLGS